jgi:TetR/AcrR family transcriptional regulator, cholesterol catabolism regulator
MESQTTVPAVSRQARTAERRRTLALAASRLISERGFDSLSVNELASEVGMSVGGLYRYIKTKSDLLVMACEDIYGDLRERIVEVVTGAEPIPEKLRRAMRVYLDACEKNHDLILLMYREYRHLPSDARRRYQAREDAVAGVFSDLLRAGMRQGLLRPANAEVISRDIIMLGHLPALKGWSLRMHADREQLAREQIDLILGRLAPQAVADAEAP